MMNRDGLYTVQAVSRDDGTKHNVVVGIEGYSSRFRNWWMLLKSGEPVRRSYNVWWDSERNFENHQLRGIGWFLVVYSSNSPLPTRIHLHLIGEGYKDIEYSLESFERFFIFKRDRPDGFGVCVTVKV